MAGILTNAQVFRYTLIACLSLSSLLTGQELSTRNKRAISYYTEASYLIRRKAFAEAAERLEEALKKDSEFREAEIRLGYAYFMDGRKDLALRTLMDVVGKYGKQSLDTGYYYFLGKLHFGNGDYEAAAPWLESYSAYSGRKIYEDDASRMMTSIQFVQQYVYTHQNVEPERLPEILNRFQLQYFPVLSGDNRIILYTRRLAGNLDYDEDIVVSVFRDSAWTSPVSISMNINSRLNEGTCAISADTRTLTYTSCNTRDGYGSCDLYISTRTGNEWSVPENMGPVINSPYWESQPSLTADGKTLYFVSDRPGGRGGLDIWVSHRRDSFWTQPVNLGSTLNTKNDEMAPSIHADGRSLFFSSNGYPGFGSYDIFVKDLLTDEKPSNLGPEINDHLEQSGFFVTSDAQWGYFSTFTYDNTVNDSSILYRIDVSSLDLATPSSYLMVEVRDRETKDRIAAEIEFRDLATDSLLYGYSIDDRSSLVTILPQGTSYGVYCRAPGYLTHSFSYTFLSDTLTILLDPLKKDVTTVLENVFFEFDSYRLRDKSRASLETVVRFLKENPDLTIAIEGHTDLTGDEDYNLSLSESRALEVKKYLVQRGIDENRIKTKGYGESRPLVTSSSAQNRRIELRIL